MIEIGLSTAKGTKKNNLLLRTTQEKKNQDQVSRAPGHRSSATPGRHPFYEEQARACTQTKPEQSQARSHCTSARLSGAPKQILPDMANGGVLCTCCFIGVFLHAEERSFTLFTNNYVIQVHGFLGIDLVLTASLCARTCSP